MPVRIIGPAVLVLAALLAALPAGAEEVLSSIARGGRLYDNWHVETGEHERRISHLRKERAEGAAGTGSGRCVECHGWDYRGADGASGGTARGLGAFQGGDPAAVAALLRHPSHGYGALLDAEDIQDLANFVTGGQVAMTDHIDPETLRARGEPARGAVYFQTICANCHGADGLQVESMPPLGELGRDQPWHALHSMMNGHPNGSMPALRALDRAVLTDTLAYLQTLPQRDPTASLVRGGRLYDNWFKENGRTPPPGLHPSFPAARAAMDEGLRPQSTWRCVECHGWDYRGRDGIAGLRNLEGADPAAVAAALSNQVHQFGGLLSVRDLTDLARFVTRGQVDMAVFIDDAERRFKGDAAAGEPFFQTICATCHGKDGRAVRTMPPLGRMVASDPWRSLHSVYNGHPGDTMPPLRAMPADIIGSILAYAQTLPAKK
ncbi:c-type cytochrome [Skermanella sp. TT6]|uniref:C-type cytochrome n=1 Tax=Skermanella cutis TaxID=2775420 RepID=A0ABX7B3P6_9PROT|nr:c-type cytochrome [Skermanella sp. TT6]QQP88961.1 c-type cytochrome [Skermanella sp. TT6]